MTAQNYCNSLKTLDETPGGACCYPLRNGLKSVNQIWQEKQFDPVAASDVYANSTTDPTLELPFPIFDRKNSWMIKEVSLVSPESHKQSRVHAIDWGRWRLDLVSHWWTSVLPLRSIFYVHTTDNSYDIVRHPKMLAILLHMVKMPEHSQKLLETFWDASTEGKLWDAAAMSHRI